MEEGKDLIRYFSVPCKPTQANGGRTRNLPRHAPEKWATYKAYNAQDVETERAVCHALLRHPLPEHEWALYALDQRINDRGVRVDRAAGEKRDGGRSDVFGAGVPKGQGVDGAGKPRKRQAAQGVAGGSGDPHGIAGKAGGAGYGPEARTAS